MNSRLSSLFDSLQGRYRVERELGRGGSASVWLAEDLRHRRDVAIKVLLPEIAATLGTDRFLAEIGTVARLAHPRILPLHDSGEAAGLVYFVMPYVNGPSLRQRLAQSGPLPLDEALGIATAISTALAYAHELGVIHRDVKPENILFLGSEPMLTDFGIARSGPAAAYPGWTGTGVAIGTPGYMSPEQTTGVAGVDGRTDQYSLACVLFEMLTGRPPFLGPDPSSLVRRHLADEPPAPSSLRAAIPTHVDIAVRRALAKSPADRFASATDFARALVGEAVHSAPSTRPLLAVLPFENRSADPEQEYFSDGLTDELIAELGRLDPRGLGVIGRTSSMRYKGTSKSVPEIGQELRASHVLGGSVRRAGDRVRITTDLVHVHDQAQLWAETYERPLADVFALQTEVARRVTEALGAHLLDAGVRPGASGGRPAISPPVASVDPTVGDLYLRGRYAWRKHDLASLRRARECFQRVIDLDPSFAPGHAGLAQAYLSLADQGDLSQLEAARSGIEQARLAIELDGSLAEAYVSLGHASIHNWDMTGADQAFSIALELNPSDPEGHSYHGYVLVLLGLRERALAAASAARALDPFSMHVQIQYAEVLRLCGRSDEAIRALEEAIETDPEFVYSRHVLAFHYLEAGRFEDSVTVVQQLGADEQSRRAAYRTLSAALAQMGRSDEGKRYLDALIEEHGRGKGGAVRIAEACVAHGLLEDAVRWLERAYEEGQTDIAFLGVEPFWDPLRGSARFDELCRRAGMSQHRSFGPWPPPRP